MHSPNPTVLPLTRDLVLIGGGHTHALVLRKLAMSPIPGVRLTLINPDATAPYSGMLPGHVAGHYPRAALEIDLVRLARAAGARLVLDRAVGLDRDAGRVILADRPGIAYDAASIDIGITSDLPDLPGFTDHAVPAKPLGPMADRWQAHAALDRPGPVVILGGGVAGVELAMACAHRLQGRAPVTVIDRGDLVEELTAKTRATLLDALTGLGITMRPQTDVTRIAADHVQLGDGETLPAALVIGAAGAKPQTWLSETGLALQDGFVAVDASLRSSDGTVFAAGDCAHMTEAPRPKAGVFAVRQAPVLAQNLRAVLTGGRLQRYSPQRDYLKLISLGGKRAVADKSGFRLAGPWLWRLKDKIDRDFMDKFQDLPQMPGPVVPSGAALGVADMMQAAPLCGGCGAKVGSGDLDSALDLLGPALRDDVLSRPGDDAAILSHASGVQVLTTDHLRAFTHDPWLMARLTLVHALGDVWAMGATPQAVLANVVLPRMAPRMQRETLREITAAAVELLTPLGAALVGGHTSQGAELTLGFSITGLARQAVQQTGAQPGDALILTRPIGTGVLLAAEMQGKADGRQIAAMFAAMAQPQDTAAAVLAPLAHAMTDVTGFGLAGHLDRMCRASGVGADLQVDRVPLYPGALAASQAGLRSSLYPANRQALPLVKVADDTDRLLFDPQTCGGLLAAVPADDAPSLCAQIAGAVVIGQVTRTPGLRLIRG